VLSSLNNYSLSGAGISASAQVFSAAPSNFQELHMNYVRGALAATLLGFACNAVADISDMPSGEYGLDDSHGYITFSYSHFGYSNPHIGFNSFDLTMNLDSADVEKSSVEVVIDATSLDSRVPAFDGHLNGANFFDTANHPTITFKSTSMTSTGENTYDVVGDLTIKGTTQSVTLAAIINKAANHPRRNTPIIGVDASAVVLRSDFGMDRAVPNVSDEVKIYISVEMPQQTD
jgi:polyisoprenoid-binding protein YceI